MSSNLLDKYLPIVKVKLNGIPVRNYVSSLDIIMSDSMHSLAQVVVNYTAPKAVKGKKVTPFTLSPLSLWKENAPVAITYGRSPAPTTTFYGYVHGNEIIHREADRRGAVISISVRYTVLAPSMHMQTQKNIAWRDVTASYIAKKIAVQNHMKAVVDPTLQVIPSRYQRGKSDFVFLTELAKQAGFRFFIDNTTLYFINPLKTLDNAAASIPSFTMDRVPGQWEGLISFKRTASSTDTSGGRVARREVIGINPRTNALVRATNEYLRYTAFNDHQGVKPLITLIRQDYTAESYEEARALLYADVLNNRLWVEAKAETEGRSAIKPGTLIKLSGRALTTDDEGVWLVKSATHKLRISLNPYRSTFRTETTLGRDQIYDVRYHHTSDYDAAAAVAKTVAAGDEWRANHYGTSNVR